MSGLLSEKAELFILYLDHHLERKDRPIDALIAAVEDYAYVYHGDDRDGSTTFNRAARVTLRHIHKEANENNTD